MSILAGLIAPAEQAAALAALSAMDAERAARTLALIKAIADRSGRNLLGEMYPDRDSEQLDDEGRPVIYRRSLYPKQLEFFEAGAKYRERCLMAANRVGKTFGAGGYETALHLTGRYPDWWVGRRFSAPVDAWAAGKSNETTRDIVQAALLGGVEGARAHKRPTGRGLIPGDTLGTWSWRQGVSDLIDTIRVKHVSGGWSVLGFKSYEQGRGSFEGTAKHVAWCDEEPPLDVYGEILIRTATTNGLAMITFTPLEGMSDVVLQFVRPEMLEG